VITEGPSATDTRPIVGFVFEEDSPQTVMEVEHLTNFHIFFASHKIKQAPNIAEGFRKTP